MATKSKTQPAAKKGLKSAKPVGGKKTSTVKAATTSKPAKSKTTVKPVVKSKSKPAKPIKAVASKAAPAKTAVKPVAAKPASSKSTTKAAEIKPHIARTPVLESVTTNSITPIIANPQNKKLVTKETPDTNHVPKSNGKGRYSDKELAEFKAIIDEKLVTARQELNYLQEQIVEMNENNADIQGSDWFDDSSIHSEVELLNNMAIRQRQFIQNLENALVRIENKTYGICTVTGNLIDKKRLLLVPHATKSIEAKHIEQASMVPDINQVSPDERVIRRSVEGKQLKKAGVKKAKTKASKDFEDEDGEELTEAPIEDMDINFGAGED